MGNLEEVELGRTTLPSKGEKGHLNLRAFDRPLVLDR